MTQDELNRLIRMVNVYIDTRICVSLVDNGLVPDDVMDEAKKKDLELRGQVIIEQIILQLSKDNLH